MNSIEESYSTLLLMQAEKQKEVPTHAEAVQKLNEIELKRANMIDIAFKAETMLRSSSTHRRFIMKTYSSQSRLRSDIVYTPIKSDYRNIDYRLTELNNEKYHNSLKKEGTLEFRPSQFKLQKTPKNMSPIGERETPSDKIFLTENSMKKVMALPRVPKKMPRMRSIRFTGDNSLYLMYRVPYNQYPVAFVKEKANQLMVITHESILISSKLEKINTILKGGINV